MIISNLRLQDPLNPMQRMLVHFHRNKAPELNGVEHSK